MIFKNKYSFLLILIFGFWFFWPFYAQRLKVQELSEELEFFKEENVQLSKDVEELSKMIDNLIEKNQNQNENPVLASLMAKTPSIFPTDGYLSSPFGYRIHPIYGVKKHHNGWDIAAARGTEVMATADGEVIKVENSRTLGKTVVLRHFPGLTTKYGHLHETAVKKGQKVKRGEKVGAVGSTGLATNPHVHFEINFLGKPINPKELISAKDISQDNSI